VSLCRVPTIPVVPVVVNRPPQYYVGYAVGWLLFWVMLVSLLVFIGALVWVWWTQRGKK